MQITVLKSKIHRATVTDANLEYVGSITIDKALLKKAGMHPWDRVDVLNVNNGERLTTYIMPGKKAKFASTERPPARPPSATR